MKQLVEDEETGTKSFRYIRTGTNHYSLAFTDGCIAATRFQPIAWHDYGRPPLPRDHVRNWKF